MFRFISSIIIIGIAFAILFTFTNPLLGEVRALREQVASYNDALKNSKALENERDLLTQKYNSFDQNDLDRLTKLLPNNVDNIRLILEIEKVATPYGMVLKDVKYDTKSENSEEAGSISNGSPVPEPRTGYGTWNLSFSSQGTYNNFINFIRDLEKNLRIVDIASVSFSSDTGVGASPSLSNIYQYNFSVKTYWLKN